MLAKTQRNQWQSSLTSGIIPDDVKKTLDLYRVWREDPCWRATRMFEQLGECALVLEDLLSKQEGDKDEKDSN